MGNVRDKRSAELPDICKLGNSECHPASRYSQGKSHDILSFHDSCQPSTNIAYWASRSGPAGTLLLGSFCTRTTAK